MIAYNRDRERVNDWTRVFKPTLYAPYDNFGISVLGCERGEESVSASLNESVRLMHDADVSCHFLKMFKFRQLWCLVP